MVLVLYFAPTSCIILPITLRELMYEGNSFDDSDFGDERDFDRFEERVAPASRVPFSYNGINMELTPANAAVRLFLGEGKQDYSRVIFYPDDGTTAPLKPEDELIKAMVRGGFPVELPDKLDESDQEFMDAYMRIWTEEVNDELDGLQ